MKRNLLRFVLLSVMSFVTLSASATPDKDYLCFTANTAGSTVQLAKSSSPESVSIEYSTDGGDNWISRSPARPQIIILPNAGDKVYFRNKSTATTFSKSDMAYYYFSMSGSIAASGNVMSLVDKDCKATTIPCEYCFCNLFKDCSALTSAPELPAATLAANCYKNMFSRCTGLRTTPELPATTLAASCYDNMFFRCSNLTTVPTVLPATTLAANCYNSMFYECTGLVTTPELPATTLAANCYYCMFSGCTALTSAPELPATTLAELCYHQMFINCNNLETAPELPATTLAANCYNSMFIYCSKLNAVKVAFSDFAAGTYLWLGDVSSDGIFMCPDGLADGLDTETRSGSNIPKGWTTVKNTYDLAITSETGWASMCVNLPLQVPTGVEVYYASAVEGTTITLTQIEAGTVMAPRTAIIVKGAKGTVGFPIVAAAGTSYPTNLFQGSSVAKACNAGENYVLNASKSSDTNVHFSIYTGTTLTDHKAYLPMSAVGGASSIQFRFGDATAISTVEMESNDDVLYNMAGQRVSSDYRGIVIKNGKKTWNN